MWLIRAQCTAARCLRSRVHLEQGQTKGPSTAQLSGVCCVLCWKAAPAPGRMKSGALPEQPGSQVINEVRKSGHIPYFEPFWLCRFM